MGSKNTEEICAICHAPVHDGDSMAVALVRHALANFIRKKHPDLPEGALICTKDLNRFRGEFLERTLIQERGEITRLESDVVHSIEQHELLTQNLQAQFEQRRSFGDKVSDAVAAFGGSWSFIGGFGFFIASWIVLNSAILGKGSFDPYPFILLNLLLSCIAAMQAPIIMMSQNRQSAMDRLRSEHDYRVNLKAELEIRHLNAKLDLLLTRQWRRLMEIQQLQTDLMEELTAKNRPQTS